MTPGSDSRPRRAGAAIALALALALAAAPAARGHDIWLQADAYVLDAGGTLVVRQLLGEELASATADGEAIQELELLWDMTPRFTLVTREGSLDLLAEPRPGTVLRPVLERRIEAPGRALVAMDHAVLYTELTNAEFLEYLDHEGLDRRAYEARMGSGPYQAEGYQRSLKCLVRVGEGGVASDLAARPLGQPIEILLLDDPYALDPGDALRVKVLLAGVPLAGQAVHALRRSADGSVARQKVTTGDDGVAPVRLDGPGLWLLRLVHLAPCSEGSAVDCEDTAWESYWSAFSFQVD